MNLAATARSAAIGSMLVLGACASEREAGRDIVWESERVAPSATAQASAGAAPGLDADGCREYTQTVRIGDEEHQAYGRACLQPDGSWRLNPPAPTPPTAAQGTDAVPAYSYPYRHYAPSVFFGSTFLFSHRHKHLHKHRHHGHGHRHFRRHRR